MSTPIAYIVLDESSPRLIAGQYQFDRACSGALIIPSGAAFPTDPFSGEIFWKTDEAKLFRRDNTNTTWQEAVGGNSDSAAAYVVIGLTSSLSNERSLSSSFGITFVDNGANNTIEININEVEIPVLSASNTFTGPNIFTSGLSGSHTHLDDGTSYLLAGPGIVINSESNGAVAISGSGGGDNDASYIVIGLTASLSNERALTSSFGNQIIDGGANGNVDIKIDETLIPTLTASNSFTGDNTFQAGLSGTLFENESGLELFVAGDLTLIDSSSTTQITISVDRQSLSGNFADVGATYVVIGNTASLPNERAVTGSLGIEIIDGGAGSTVDFRISEEEIPILSASNTFTGLNIFTAGLSGSLTHLSDGTSYLLEGANVQITSGSNIGVTVAVAGDIGVWKEEIIVSQIVNGINADLTATLTYEPISTGSVSVYVNTAFQIQHNPSGNYVLTGATNQTIHWLASSSLSAFDLDATDCVLVKYLR